MICRKCSATIPEESKFCNLCGWNQSKTPSGKRTKSRGNGTGSIYQLPDGRWKVEVVQGWIRDENGQRLKKKRRTGVFDRKKDALAAIESLKNKTDQMSLSFHDLYTLWSKKHYANLSKSKETAYTIAYKKCEALYWRNIQDIKLSDMQSVVDERGSSYYTKKDIRDLLSLMWQYACQNDYVAKNYADYIELPPQAKSNKDAFTSEEIQKLWDDYHASPAEHAVTGYILTMIYTGMRYGEISKIRLENIHLQEQYMIGGIKTDAGKNREILICNKLVPVIQDLIEGKKKKLLEMNEDNFRAQYKSTLARAGVRPLTPHCCRHTTATALTLAGIPPAIIKDIMGHANFSTTVGYTHIKLQEKLEAINQI